MQCDKPCNRVSKNDIICDGSNEKPEVVFEMAGRCIEDSLNNSHLNVTLPDRTILTNKLLMPIKKIQNLQLSSVNNSIKFQIDSFKDLKSLEVLDVAMVKFDNNELKDATSYLTGLNSFKEIRLSSTFTGCSCSYYSLVKQLQKAGTRVYEEGLNDCVSSDKDGLIISYYCNLIITDDKIQRFIYFILIISLLGIVIAGIFAINGLLSALSTPYCYYIEEKSSYKSSFQPFKSDQKELIKLKDIIDPCNRTEETNRQPVVKQKEGEKIADFIAKSPAESIASNKEEIDVSKQQKERQPFTYPNMIQKENPYNFRSKTGLIVAAPEGCKERLQIVSPSVKVQLSPTECGGTEFVVSKSSDQLIKLFKNSKSDTIPIKSLQEPLQKNKKNLKARRKKNMNRSSNSFGENKDHLIDFKHPTSLPQFANRGQPSQKLYGVMKRMSEEVELNSSKNNYYTNQDGNSKSTRKINWKKFCEEENEHNQIG